MWGYECLGPCSKRDHLVANSVVAALSESGTNSVNMQVLERAAEIMNECDKKENDWVPWIAFEVMLHIEKIEFFKTQEL